MLHLFFFMATAFSGFAASSLTTITSTEQSELDRRVARFYHESDNPDLMDVYIPKFSPNTQAWVHSHPYLKLKDRSFSDPLLQMAQQKATPEFQKFYCEKFLKGRFPDLYFERCVKDSRAGSEPGARAADTANRTSESLGGVG